VDEMGRGSHLALAFSFEERGESIGEGKAPKTKAM